ncbi:hypothetical protein ACFSTC_36840 [Nonomuraea ferruginea]
MTFVLVHSPSVGPSTWAPVAQALERRGHQAVVPDLTGVTGGGPPHWPRIVEAVRAATPAGGARSCWRPTATPGCSCR